MSEMIWYASALNRVATAARVRRVASLVVEGGRVLLSTCTNELSYCAQVGEGDGTARRALSLDRLAEWLQVVQAGWYRAWMDDRMLVLMANRDKLRVWLDHSPLARAEAVSCEGFEALAELSGGERKRLAWALGAACLRDGARDVLRSAHVVLRREGLRVSAMDGYRFHSINIPLAVSSHDRAFVVWARGLAQALSAAQHWERVVVGVAGNALVVSDGAGAQFTLPSSAVTWFDYSAFEQDALRADCVSVDAGALKRVVRACLSAAHPASTLRFTSDGQSLRVRAAGDEGWVTAQLDVSHPPVEVSLSGEYLVDALRDVKGAVELSLRADAAAFVRAGDRFAMIMPVKEVL